MKRSGVIATTAALLLASPFAAPAQEKVSDGIVKIGMLEDMSSIYADITGMGAVTAAMMAVEISAERCWANRSKSSPRIIRTSRILLPLLCGNGSTSSTSMRSWMSPLRRPRSLLSSLPRPKTRSSSSMGPARRASPTRHARRSRSITLMTITRSLTALAPPRSRLATTHGFFLTADYAFGHDLEQITATFVRAGGGRVLGGTRVPINTLDFSSALLQAQASKAKVIGLANAGADTTNSIKQAAEFGIVRGGQKLAGLLV